MAGSLTVLRGIEGLRALPRGCVMSIGNFDGLHLGHRRLLQTCHALIDGRDAALAVVTFEPHPLTVLKPRLAPPRLSPPAIKHALLAEHGVTHLVELPPSPEVLNLEAEDFWHILRDEVRPTDLVEGGTFTFGKGRGGTIDRLRQWTRGSSVRLHVLEPVEAVLLDLQVVPVSSSLVRWLLANGRVRDAAICLGRPYVLEGTVVKGFQRGREFGIPTANLDCGDQHIPADGVYVGRCTVDDVTYPAAVSIGTLPTFDNVKFQIEAHLLDFNSDLYGQVLRVEMIDWLRDQRRYANIDLLKQQMTRDLAGVRELAFNQPHRAFAAAI